MNTRYYVGFIYKFVYWLKQYNILNVMYSLKMQKKKEKHSIVKCERINKQRKNKNISNPQRYLFKKEKEKKKKTNIVSSFLLINVE